MRFLTVGLGGFLGANARYYLGTWIQARYGGEFPLGTFVINVTGCFILGLFSTLAQQLAWSDRSRLLVATGFVGAYTTFSTFEMESLHLAEDHVPGAALNLVGSVAVGFVAAYAGMVAGRLLTRRMA